MTIPARRPHSQHAGQPTAPAAGRVPRRRTALSRAANAVVDHIVDTAPGALGAALDALLRVIDRVLGTPVPPTARAATTHDGPANPCRRRDDIQAPPAKPKTFTTPAGPQIATGDPTAAAQPAPTSSAPQPTAPTVPAATPAATPPAQPLPRSATARHLPAGQHIIRVTCDDGGDAHVASSEIQLVVYNDALDQSWYGFACPACGARHVKFASLEARSLLINQGGVTPTFTTTSDDPNGTGRTRDQAARDALNDALPPLTTDAVLDATLWLNTVDDLATAARTTDLSDGGR